MDRHAITSGDKAHYIITGERITALRILYRAVVDTVKNDSVLLRSLVVVSYSLFNIDRLRLSRVKTLLLYLFFLKARDYLCKLYATVAYSRIQIIDR